MINITSPTLVYNRISSAKNALITPEEYINDYGLQQEDMRANRPMTGQIYDAYCKRCFKNGAMDFDDLLIKILFVVKHASRKPEQVPAQVQVYNDR